MIKKTKLSSDANELAGVWMAEEYKFNSNTVTLG